MKLEEVSEPVGALHTDQDGVLLQRTEAHGQAVGPRTRPLVGSPGVGDEGASFTKDIRGSSCRGERDGGGGRGGGGGGRNIRHLATHLGCIQGAMGVVHCF